MRETDTDADDALRVETAALYLRVCDPHYDKIVCKESSGSCLVPWCRKRSEAPHFYYSSDMQLAGKVSPWGCSGGAFASHTEGLGFESSLGAWR